jgi:hypothetical protein
MCDRRGIGQEWEEVDDEIKDEILANWVGWTEKCLSKQPEISAFDNLPELTDDERKAMESIDLTDVLGTWEERHNVVMNAAKRMLRERVELKAEIKRLREELDLHDMEIKRLRAVGQ